MSRPLYDSLNEYEKKQYSSFHTPGHKGVGGLDFAYDITEIWGFESLYSGKGILRETEKMLSQLFGEETILLAGGSTLGVQTMIGTATQLGDSIIAPRGLHQSAINAFALLDITPIWIYQNIDTETRLAKPTTLEEVEGALKENPTAKGVYLTSPDYYGRNADIGGISKICKKHGKILIVDGAHGAHFPFLEPTAHPISLGADISCASLHKTLPVMTGGAVISVNGRYTMEQIKQTMSLFGSTSPSYAVMTSADLLGRHSREEYIKLHRELANVAGEIKTKAEEKGFLVPKGDVDPIRITLGFFPLGYTKAEFLKALWNYKIQPEYLDDHYCVLIPTINNSSRDFQRLSVFIRELPKGEKLVATKDEYPQPKVGMSLRKAVFAPWETVDIHRAKGRISASMIAPCPPGVPKVMPGEIFDDSLITRLKKDGVFTVNVVQYDYISE